LKVEWVTQEKGSNLSYEAWIGVKLERERGFELKKGWFKVYSSELSGQPSWGVRGAFYSPQKESAH
jgi:hypothetical protein